jgi:hypothetical protein
MEDAWWNKLIEQLELELTDLVWDAHTLVQHWLALSL